MPNKETELRNQIFSIYNENEYKIIIILGIRLKFNLYKKYIDNVLKKHPVQENKIVFSNYMGKSFGGNSKYILNEILKRKLPYDIVWLLNNDNSADEIPNGVRVVPYKSKQAFFELMTSKIWVDNYHKIDFIKKGLPKRDGQIYIQNWHGSLGIKRIEKSVPLLTNDELWEKCAIENSKMTDYWISNSAFETNVYKESFWEVKNIKEFGHPQNDIFFNPDNTVKEKVFEKYNIPKDKKILLYAPTFREDMSFDCYNIDYSALKNSLMQKFGGEWVILARLHHRIAKKANKFFNNRKDILDASMYPDMQELMYASDILISDYSSCMFDFMLSRKPVFIYATDIEKYNKERGFYYPLETTPFPIAVNNKALSENIINFGRDKYIQQVEQFLKEKGCMEDGHASERVADLIEGIINGK